MKIEAPRPYVIENLKYALNPSTVAVIGASRHPNKVGYKVIEGLIKWGYRGTIYPVNPAAGDVQGLPSYRSLADVPDPVDLVFIAVPARAVPEVIEAAAAKHARVVAVSSSDFKETGRGDIQDEMTRFCRAHECRSSGRTSWGWAARTSGSTAASFPICPCRARSA